MAVDARSDLYSVGAVGYVLLIGRSVFDVHDFNKLARKHVQEMPEPLSKRVG